jgi:electron transfer flavoprotein alpha/beta subunit
MGLFKLLGPQYLHIKKKIKKEEVKVKWVKVKWLNVHYPSCHGNIKLCTTAKVELKQKTKKKKKKKKKKKERKSGANYQGDSLRFRW